MKPKYFVLFIIVILSQSCNTIYNTSVVDIEIYVPGKIKVPDNYRTIAIRYNNVNVAPNSYFQDAYYLGETIVDNKNIDSIASVVYFQHFFDAISNETFFDTVIEIAPGNYNQVKLTDTITYPKYNDLDLLMTNAKLRQKFYVSLFSQAINQFPNTPKEALKEQLLHPSLALYQPKELQGIADSTHADILLSLDFFSSIDGIMSNKNSMTAQEFVVTQGYWNIYDLKKQELSSAYNRSDTIQWKEFFTLKSQIKKLLPPRKDAVLNAADIAGTNFANFLIPHWLQVQRMYYSSGHVDLQKTDKLVEEGKWMEAAEIWKANTTNPNKSIAAKSKFNMGLVCEMQGNLAAALEWVVESFLVLGQDNTEHYLNCTDYIGILAKRKRDMVILDKQMSPAN